MLKSIIARRLFSTSKLYKNNDPVQCIVGNRCISPKYCTANTKCNLAVSDNGDFISLRVGVDPHNGHLGIGPSIVPGLNLVNIVDLTKKSSNNDNGETGTDNDSGDSSGDCD